MQSARSALMSNLSVVPNESGMVHSTSTGSQAPLPGLQDLRGQWSGTFQAYGGAGGATNVDFNARGRDWRWGDYALDHV